MVTKSISLYLVLLFLNFKAYGAAESQIGTLSDGSCWYENKEFLKIASFNDKSLYLSGRNQLESELERLLILGIPKIEQTKVNELELSLHCGGYGASLVAKINADGKMFCLWAKFEKGKLGIRSVGVLSNEQKNLTELCDGHKWGEFVLSLESDESVLELETPEWSSMIKSITLISKKLYKVNLTSEYEFREQEVIDRLESNFSGKNPIRYIEYNNYQHPAGEFVHFKN